MESPETDVSTIYQALSQRDHVLQRPETYVGPVRKRTESRFVVNPQGVMEEREVTFSPAFLKVVDEIVNNAADRRVAPLEKRDFPVQNVCNKIWIEVNAEEGVISVQNNGDGIPTDVHKEHNVHIPELILGRLLTGSNFNDKQQRVSGGRNGYGSKLTNIFSEWFEVQTVGMLTGKGFRLYTQMFRNNMSEVDPPVITTYRNKPYTKITFKLDLKRFEADSFTPDMVDLLRKRAYDLAATTPKFCKSAAVYFNGEQLPIKTFEAYSEMFYPQVEGRLFATPAERWKVGFLFAPGGGYRHVSYVNGVSTYTGGTHVEYVAAPIISAVVDAVKAKKKGSAECRVKPANVREHLVVFVDSLIVNPEFGSQTKEQLVTRPSDYGSSWKPEDRFLNKILRCGIVERVLQDMERHEGSLLKVTDGRKTDRVRGIPKLEDATLAGTRRSQECTLILTEGDSAKTTAVSGLSRIGRERYGVFPLRGKLLNVREANTKQIFDNEEITNLKKILGLQQGKDYTKDLSGLRYGCVMIFTDQDVDGSHIKGLLMNMFHTFWPGLLQAHPGFLRCLETPIVKATNRRRNTKHQFFNLADYQAWWGNLPANERGQWIAKYYKGLGTSTREESLEYFTDLNKKLLSYCWDNDTNNAMTLAFAKERADDRKTWLVNRDPSQKINTGTNKVISFSEFVNLELISFSEEDNVRSIPSVIDGMKPSQRKVLYGAKRRRLDRDEVKVAQLSGYVSDVSAYHHGEASLNQTIVGMAQDFVGSNNINLLDPRGQFGTRLENGKDSASPRYIFTALSPVTPHIFMEADDGILEQVEDDGQLVEPVCYLPILCVTLVNGTQGIGTGFSTDLPPFHPKDVMENQRRWLFNTDFQEMTPWYRGFSGSILPMEGEPGKFRVLGSYQVVSPTTVVVDELPVGTSTSKYKLYLEGLVEEKALESYVNESTDVKVRFTLNWPKNSTVVQSLSESENKVLSALKLESRIHLKNIHLWTTPYAGEIPRIKKYSGPLEVLEDYCKIRMVGYVRRKELMLNILRFKRDLLFYKARFLQKKIDGEIVLEKRSVDDVIKDLEAQEFPRLRTSYESPDPPTYSYITSMPLFSLTETRMSELLAELKSREEELKVLEATTEKEMWLKDLSVLEECLKRAKYPGFQKP